MIMDKLSAANHSIFESCPSTIIRVNQNNKIVQISPELCTLLKLEMANVIDHTPAEASPLLAQLLESSETIEITTDNGTPYQFSHTVFEINENDIDTHVFTNISTVLDLYGENERLKEEARQLQLIDPDTSLLTQRALLLVLESQLSQCRRYETSLSVIKLNLEIASDSPDLRLKALKISRLLKDQLRWSDMIARSSDKQFTIILPETDYQDALNLSGKLTQAITQWNDDFIVNIGIVEWSKTMSSSDLLDYCEQEVIQHKSGQDVA